MLTPVTWCRSDCCVPSVFDFEVAGSSIVCLIFCLEGIKFPSTRDGRSFMFKCGNTQKGPIPLFSIFVRCSAYGRSYSLRVEVFCAIWEFAQSRDCVTHSQNPEIVFKSWDCLHSQSRDCVTHMCNLEIVWFACTIYDLSTLPVRPTVSNLLCMCNSQDGRQPW